MIERTPRNRVMMSVVGFMMMTVSTPCVLAMISDLVTQSTDNITGALIVGSFMGFVGIAGIVLLVNGLRKPKAIPFTVDRSMERRILGLAKARRGNLTVAELALRTDLTIEESRQALEHFELREVARSHVTDNGDIVFHFPDFSTGEAPDDVAFATTDAVLDGFDDDGSVAEQPAGVAVSAQSANES